ncbi:MAG TPA: flagellar protein FlgN [Firmicutes bacterium]|jgi:flagellar biosynthesis/type III secretory pathway chaperone|nr:flagellar protein FlgN [Bacillota bacterium]
MRGLAEILQEELDTVQNLRDVAVRERNALRIDDLEGITAATAAKERLARRLGELERERQQAVEALHGETEAVAELKERLQGAVAQLKDLSTTNLLLTRQLLHYVRKVLLLLDPEQMSGRFDRTV